jgi:SPX domain protein involved in polyphosphate accumulation
MQSDKNADGDGEYRVTSLYFDDMFRSAYKDKLHGVLKRKKHRIRAYNLSPDRITLEVKYKDGNFVRKSNAALSLDEYHALLRGDYAFCLGREEMKDFYAYAKMSNLKPAAITDYVREAYIADAGNVRITFDKNISAGMGNADMFKASYTPVSDDVVLEIKYDDFLPTYIQELFTGFPMMAEPVSKFLLCANKFSEVNIRWQI